MYVFFLFQQETKNITGATEQETKSTSSSIYTIFMFIGYMIYVVYMIYDGIFDDGFTLWALFCILLPLAPILAVLCMCIMCVCICAPCAYKEHEEELQKEENQTLAELRGYQRSSEYYYEKNANNLTLNVMDSPYPWGTIPYDESGDLREVVITTQNHPNELIPNGIIHPNAVIHF